MIIRADVFITSVLHAKPLRDYAKLHKSQPFIQMPGMNVRSNDRVKLQDAKTVCRSLHQTILHQLFPNVQAACILTNGIAGIADMTASTHIIGMQNIQAINFSRINILRNGTKSLTCKKTPFPCLP